MDLHPLFVHFPVALLTVYAVLEIIRHWTPGEGWRTARALLVIVGTAFSFASLATGEAAEHAFGKPELIDVLETHSIVANVTTWIFAILAASYLLTSLWVRSSIARGPSFLARPFGILSRIASTILRTPISIIAAILGFLAMGLVGALGGILAYGPDFDPITSAVYRLLF
jgi:uncharacterized membrane protein